MQKIFDVVERLNHVTGIPVSLVNREGQVVRVWPSAIDFRVDADANRSMIHDFYIFGGEINRPVIRFIEPGFLLGIMQFSAELFLFFGLVSPYRHSREEIVRMVSTAIHPVHLKEYIDWIQKLPLVPLEKLKDLMCLASELAGKEITPGAIVFVDTVSVKLGGEELEKTMFYQREEPQEHVATSFEEAICAAIEAGDRGLLERSLFSPYHGHVGRMSQSDLRQIKYAFISLATLASRAAIRGGMEPETAFSLSDLYCQRADLMTEIHLVENLTFTMLMDYCEKVRETKGPSGVSPLIEKAIAYISVHLHESFGLEDLSKACGLCGRSLSLRFRAETGLGITEYIHREKLREGKYLLQHTDYSLAEITAYLNYPSQSYFTQIFRKYNGTTPKQFRDTKKN
ncbi:MAG: helix-turn-helix domain-containing protein [Firmicutes bacterium]|nr:helix-turn-helix domain-containing protein [Bacillota bacterium]